MRGTKLTISGNLSLSKRIVRGTSPLSLYASSPVGVYRGKEESEPHQDKKKAGHLLYWLTDLQCIRNFWK